jgi:hypothetical protein
MERNRNHGPCPVLLAFGLEKQGMANGCLPAFWRKTFSKLSFSYHALKKLR